jgi:hypothetical protein
MALPPVTLLSIAFAFPAGGCGGSEKKPKGPTGPSSSTTVIVSTTDAGATSDGAIAWPDVGTLSTADAGTVATADATPPADDAPAESGVPCWKGFVTTGNDVADLQELGKRCCAGMTPLVGPVKQVFKQGEVKTIPVPFVPGCYRIIAVGGTGLKNVDLDLKDQGGKEIAADKTPNDVFPMIHPNKEFCVDAVQFLNLSIIVTKGSGEVAGEVWKR